VHRRKHLAEVKRATRREGSRFSGISERGRARARSPLEERATTQLIQFPVISGLRAVGRIRAGGQSRRIRERGGRLACIERPDFAAGQPGQPDFNLADLTRRPNSPVTLRERSKDSAPRRPCARNPFPSWNMPRSASQVNLGTSELSEANFLARSELRDVSCYVSPRVDPRSVLEDLD
jgi:hypothetical protein